MYQEDDIIDVVLTDTVERTEVKRSIGNTLSILLDIEAVRDEVITIVPLSKGNKDNE